jgi:indole-3-glycerol phosphate synthase
VCRAEDERGEPAKTDVLAEILGHKRKEVDAAKMSLPLEGSDKPPADGAEPRPFYAALRGPGLALIAEIKKASPSGGVLREDFNPVEIAKIYQEAGANALSVLTDEKYFQGSLEHLREVRESCALPILRKDFIIDEYQIVEAARAGANAVLLIAACLDDAQLKGFREAAEAEGMDALVEVHNETELERARASGVRILGINNRNLKTLETSLEATRYLSRKVPPEKGRDGLLLVSESGIRGPRDTQCLRHWGVNAVLIGETFMRAPDIGAKVHEVMGAGDYMI